MNIPFWKMHGAGNDFILVDDRSLSFPATDRVWIANMATRRTGVGCEGIILIQPSKRADFRMRFFNPDGAEAEMCGNGARCVARLAHELGAAPARMTIETKAGIIKADALKSAVRLGMTPPSNWKLARRLVVGGKTIRHSFVNTGVPHAVVVVGSVARLQKTDVLNMGRAIRRHSAFAPAGTNANFIAVTGRKTLSIRTYERGVEAETLACGTGIVAAAVVAARLGLAGPPVRVTCAGGDVLKVDFTRSGDKIENVTLLGPAEHVFTGVVTY